VRHRQRRGLGHKEGDGSWTFTTYGRTPATELILEENKVPSDTVLTQISAAAAKIPAKGGCLGLDDVETPKAG